MSLKPLPTVLLISLDHHDGYDEMCEPLLSALMNRTNVQRITKPDNLIKHIQDGDRALPK